MGELLVPQGTSGNLVTAGVGRGRLLASSRHLASKGQRDVFTHSPMHSTAPTLRLLQWTMLAVLTHPGPEL